MLRQSTRSPQSWRVADWVSCGLHGQHLFHTNYNCCWNQSRIEVPREILLAFVYRKLRFSSGDISWQKKKKKKQAICCCLCVSEVGASHRIRGATAAVQQSLSFSVGATMFHKSDSFATTPATSRAPCEPATEPLTATLAALLQLRSSDCVLQAICVGYCVTHGFCRLYVSDIV